MVTQREWLIIKELRGRGLSVPKVSRQTGWSTTTIYRLENLNGPKVSQKRVKSYKKLSKYKNYLDSRLKHNVTNIKKLFYELQSSGFKGSYSYLYQYLKSNPKETTKYKQSIHIETDPGEQAQVDWGYFGKITIGDRIAKLYCFVYVLGYSRAIYMEFTIKQDLKTLEQCHIHAFKQLGFPKTILYDNMKTIVLSREKVLGSPEKIHYNPDFLDFSQYYGFKVIACPPYWPRAKGKVESAIKLVRNNFMQGMKYGKDFSNLEEINQKAKLWLRTFANVRNHGTTNEKPIKRWAIEKPFLRFPKDLPDYQISPFVARSSTKDGLIQYKSNFYSVPTQFSRRKLLIKEINEHGIAKINIYAEDKVVAIHILSYEKRKWIIEDRHLIRERNKKIKSKKQKKIIKQTGRIFTRPLSYYDQLISKSG